MKLRDRGIYRLGKAELIAADSGDGAYTLFYPRDWMALERGAFTSVGDNPVLWPDGVITLSGTPLKERGADLVDTGKTAG